MESKREGKMNHAYKEWNGIRVDPEIYQQLQSLVDRLVDTRERLEKAQDVLATLQFVTGKCLRDGCVYDPVLRKVVHDADCPANGVY